MAEAPFVRFSKDPDDELVSALAGVQDVLMRYPMAAQAVFAALAAEGRRFEITPEGAAWAERLAGSELVGQLRLVWDCLGMTAFDEDAGHALPSFFVDGMVRAAVSADPDSLIANLFKRGV